MALMLERDTAHGIGMFMPDTNRTFICWQGTMPMPVASGAGFPQAFLDGLTSMQEYGVAAWPMTLRVDDETGNTCFYNADDVCFWVEEIEGPWSADWVLQLRCGDVNSASWQASRSATQRQRIAALLCPTHVEAQWVFIAPGDAEAYRNGRIAAQLAARRGRDSAPYPPRGNSEPGPELWITAFNLTNDTYNIAAKWNELVVFPDFGELEVWFTESLAPQEWTHVASFTVPDNAEDIEFSLTKEEIFGAAIQPTFSHEPGCDPQVNTAPSPLDPNKIYTNSVCSCAANWKSQKGFFRLKVPGTEITIGALPQWWKLFYGFDPFYDWDELLDFNNSGMSLLDAYLLGQNPIAPPNTAGVTAGTLQYHYDDDDRLTHTFSGADGKAVIRHLTPAGNAEVQQER